MPLYACTLNNMTNYNGFVSTPFIYLPFLRSPYLNVVLINQGKLFYDDILLVYPVHELGDSL